MNPGENVLCDEQKMTFVGTYVNLKDKRVMAAVLDNDGSIQARSPAAITKVAEEGKRNVVAIVPALILVTSAHP